MIMEKDNQIQIQANIQDIKTIDFLYHLIFY